MRGMFLVAGLVVAGCAQAAPANTASSHIRAAETFVKAALGDDCDMDDRKDIPVNAADQGGVSHFVYSLAYHYSWDKKDDPPHKAELYQMFCEMGAYNRQYAFLLRDADSDSFKLLAFARPDTHFDYTNEKQTALKSPPRVTGYVADNLLVNAKFDARTQTISSHAAWRGLGDAWDAGAWRLADGAFSLKRYEVDPTYDQDGKPAKPGSYVVFTAP